MFFNRYRNNILGIISDVEFLKNKKKTKDAGFELVKWVRNIDQSIPILIQSSQEKNRIHAKEMGTDFLHKESPTFLKKLRDFMNYNFGFGDFLFRLPDNTQIQKAKTINEFIEGIESIPDNSIVHHAKNHHFSNWLAARAEFNLASMIRSISVDNFDSGESIRKYILKHLKNDKKENKSTIINYSSSRFNGSESDFFRLSSGSLGGKARGLGFAKSMINYSNIKNKFSNFKIRVPKSAVIGTNEFDRFMKDNELWDIALSNISDTKLLDYFLKSRISIDLTLKLESFINENNFPIAVRSSSLLEDSQYQPLAGTYETIMLSNNSKSNKERLNKLIEAIKIIYASTFNGEARTLLKNTAHRIEEEKMAILIQEVVGVKYKSNRFYPTFSGVLQSINYYPVSYMKRNEGVAYLALGFGRTIADGEKCLRISPKYPKILPQFFSLKATIQNSQNEFYAMNFNLNQQNNHQLNKYTLEDAETDGTLKWVGSSISKEDGTIKDSLFYPGTRIVSFSPILKWGNISFDKLALEILSIGKKALGCPVEIEFAVNIKKDSTPEFYLLQIKPMVLTGLHRANTIKAFDKNSIFCKSSFSLGDGRISSIKDLIIVRPNTFDLSKSKEIAKELSKINSKFNKGRQYILCGPGRWGSTDPWLGIPVQWQSISNSKVIIEMGLKELPIDPSFGSHFFQNITNLHISYFTIDNKQKDDILNLDFLKNFDTKNSGKYIDWYSFEKPF